MFCTNGRGTFPKINQWEWRQDKKIHPDKTKRVGQRLLAYVTKFDTEPYTCTHVHAYAHAHPKTHTYFNRNARSSSDDESVKIMVTLEMQPNECTCTLCPIRFKQLKDMEYFGSLYYEENDRYREREPHRKSRKRSAQSVNHIFFSSLLLQVLLGLEMPSI